MHEKDENSSTIPAPQPSQQAGTREKRSDYRETFRGFLFYTALLLVFLAILQFYFTVQGMIGTWFADEYIPIINAGFYLCVILGGLYVVRTYLLRQKEG